MPVSPFRSAGLAIRSLLAETCDAVASVVFSAPCRICAEPLDTASRVPICRRCLSEMLPLPAPFCQKCGRPFVSAVAGTAQKPLCHACRRNMYAFDLARSYAAYDAKMVRAITLLKYEALTPLGGWFAVRLAELVARQGETFAADVVVPVPLHKSRLRERGYNQAELIARPLASRLRLPLRPHLLVRTKPRPEKLKLTNRERWSTVRGAYATCEGTRVDNLRVLLVDDVFTTGATLDSCARALRRAGAGNVLGLTVARAVSNWAQQARARDELGRSKDL